ncbi:MAG: imidazole glycerol phosphate synthase subunit HisH [Selenomonas sp.]|nr:imidazole glycerol phosphate synthase subunit HisH [Selenomonas sp.]
MIAVIDYGVGNLFSVEKALAALGAEVRVTSDAAEIAAADKIVLPGVGAFGDCMKNLTASGLIPVIRDCVAQGLPLLGICVGLQILFDGSEESPGVAGLGLLKGMVRKIQAPQLKVPHMGWNSLEVTEPRQQVDLFKNLPARSYVYFVHSYHAVPADHAIITSAAVYGELLTASVAAGNIQATQFHPEKSGDVGLTILNNFIEG